MIESLLAALEQTPAAQWLRGARWGYAAVNGAHVLGIAMLVGAILPLDLRLLGLWRSTDRETLVRVLTPVAAAGLILAMTAGLGLFAVRAREYAGLDILLLKLALIAIGAGAAITAHLRAGRWLQGASDGALRLHGLLSMTCWLGALACGRLIAFVT